MQQPTQQRRTRPPAWLVVGVPVAYALATGVQYRRLEADAVDRLVGRGVHYGSAPGEAAAYQDAEVQRRRLPRVPRPRRHVGPAAHVCMSCGQVGCCDSSKNRHASRHAAAVEHPVMRSLEQGEDWLWCTVDRRMVEAPRAQPPGSAA